MARPNQARIDLAALRQNLGLARQLAPRSKAMAVAKANAYGHGALTVARELDPLVDALAVACLEEAQALTPASDFRRFVAPDVTPQVRNAALKRLFTDPQFNVMDGLDIYIDDYGRPDPLPAGMLRKMTQSAFLNLFADDPTPAPDGEGGPS